MSTWQEFERAVPDLAARVRARLEANKHHVLATLRRDGSPRVSGTEVDFFGADLTIGAMTGALKSRDLRRDARYSLHTNPGSDPEMKEGGDAKISGTAVEVTDPDTIRAAQGATEQPAPGDSDLFLLKVSEVSYLWVPPGSDAVLIDLWREGEPLKRFARRDQSVEVLEG